MAAPTPSMQGKICLVTGATSGIGRVTAQALAQQGATVVLVGRNPARTAATIGRNFLTDTMVTRTDMRRWFTHCGYSIQ